MINLIKIELYRLAKFRMLPLLIVLAFYFSYAEL
ncbi:hypothetical protein IGI39_001524 [Enterococcus sp. AZ135]